MKELSLGEIKAIELNLLNVFDAFCKKNHIKYFLSNGTLLGAVKYKGFIPWDDDIDVLVPRQDYNKLIKLFQDNERYKLFAYERNNKYRFPFAKLCDMTTEKEEKGIDNGVNLGIDIDIFPLDSWSSELGQAKREAKSINRQMFMLGLSKIKKAYSKTFIKQVIKSFLMLCCKIVGSGHFVKNIIRKSENQNISKYSGCKSWCIYGEREIIPKEVFSGATEVEFEGYTFPAPIGYDTYLRCMYGDYEKDPPKEKQKTHHDFKAYKL